ncbi:hypothetical protein [Acinetobacter sp. WCHA39]|uniref:hypothetical protein n=1 Tax=Acinetobacter sp. WCHA39 TaxID=2004648 RepID=UPI001D0D2CE1|nr:hypothetical protein [Acinetobacter sp. WCHA39]
MTLLKSIYCFLGRTGGLEFFYETGQHIIDDSMKIVTYAEPSRAKDFFNINKRIVVKFADDKSKNYTNHTILMLDYLEDIENIIIFNPQNNTFFES